MNVLKLVLSEIATRSTGVNLSGANNLFGSLAKGQFPFNTNMDFIPMDNEGGIMRTKEGHSPVWLGLQSKSQQYWAYRYCAPLAAVIDRIAEADTNGKIEFTDEDGNTIKNVNKIPRLKRIKNLLYNPNPWQTFEEFNSQQVILAKTFGYCPVFAIGGGLDKTYSKALVNISPNLCNPIRNENFDIYDDDNNNPILEWEVVIHGNKYTIPDADILLVKDGYVDSEVDKFGLPLSKVAGLDFSISNICAAMEADNVLLKKKGPLGVFSHEYKPDLAGLQPMTQTAKDDLQDDLKRYGLTLEQLQYVISKYPIKWNPMSFNLRDLMTKETVRQGIDNICDRLGYPAELMSGKNATYENRSSAERFLYQTVIIPFSLRRMARYNKFFGLEDDIKLYLDYDHLAVLQEDIMRAGQARKANSESLLIDWQAGMITWNEYRIGIEMDTVVGGDIYYPEWLKANPNMKPEKTKKTNNDTSSKDTGAAK